MQPHIIEFITVGFGVFLLMFEAFTTGNKSRLGLIAAGGLTVILALQCFAPLNAEIPEWMSRFYAYDHAARFFKIIALVSTILPFTFTENEFFKWVTLMLLTLSNVLGWNRLFLGFIFSLLTKPSCDEM